MTSSTVREGIIEELFKPARRNYPRMKIQVRGLYETLSIDLVDMQKYAHQNKNFKYILTMIDNFSKFAWAFPLKSKSGKEVAATLAKVINGQLPIKNLMADEGNEFFNVNVRALLKRHGGINLYHSYSPIKAAIIERFNRTLRHLMHPEFMQQGNVKWLDLLPKLVDRYNHTKHRTIKMTPIEATNPAKEQEIFKKIYRKTKVVKKEKNPKFKVKKNFFFFKKLH